MTTSLQILKNGSPFWNERPHVLGSVENDPSFVKPFSAGKRRSPTLGLPLTRTMFGDRLKALRRDLGLTDDEMAEHLGMSKSTYWRLEHTAKPHLDRVKKVSETFQVNAYDWLQEEMPPDANAKPRVVHIAERPMTDESDANWRSHAIDLLARMADMLESIIRSSRGGGGKLADLDKRMIQPRLRFLLGPSAQAS